MAITEKEYPLDRNKPGVVVVRGAAVTQEKCQAPGCHKYLVVTNQSGFCNDCRRKHKQQGAYTDGNKGGFPAYLQSGPREPLPPPVPIPDQVLRSGKSVNPRGFWAAVKLGALPDGAADLWHCERKRADIPFGYTVVARVVPDSAPGKWQVLGEE